MSEHAARGSWPRSVTVVVAATAALVGVVAWLWPDLTAVAGGELTEAPFDAALARTAAAVAALCAGWWWAVTCVTAVGAAAGAARVRGCPAWWHRAILGACGVAVVSALAGPPPATADTGRESRGAALVQGLPLPVRPLGSRSRPALAPTSSVADVVIVAAGDSLWSLAAARLPRGATDAEVDAAWRRLYVENRAVIGADPDLIHPGVRLRVPGGRR